MMSPGDFELVYITGVPLAMLGVPRATPGDNPGHVRSTLGSTRRILGTASRCPGEISFWAETTWVVQELTLACSECM